MSVSNTPIFRATYALSDVIPLHVHLVKGANYSVWIDSGVKPMFPQLQETMRAAGVAPGDVKFILHTHSHHDHIGCNAQLKALTGCLIGAPAYYAEWHADFERHYQDFARPFPHLVPDTPELRAEVLDILDAPAPLDLYTDEGSVFDLGGGVRLRAYSLPGHMKAELGWMEEGSQTLILGDAITGLDWPLFHSHLSVQGYRDSLREIEWLLDSGGVRELVFAHYPPMPPDAVRGLLEKAHAYIDAVETTLIRVLAESETVSLETLWSETCARMKRQQEFRALNMVNAHVQDLLARGFIRQVGDEQYTLR
jgi:glyoxylase-like metal-dependent hydrolase (beta-lactamase superfamily II)